jgi:hypothetical protein
MSNNFQSLQEAVRTCLDYWKAGKTDSLIDFTKPTRVEPICIVDAAVIHNDMLPEVMQSLLSIYTGYYLQAISVMATVGKVQVLKQLDRLNPERDLLENAANSNFFTMVKENYSDRLPMPLKSTAMEAQGADVKKMQAEMDEMRKKLEAQGKAPPIGITKDSIATAKELSNLSVGKLINVEIQDGGNKQSIAVNVRLITSSVPTKTLIHILTLDGEDKSWNDRMRGFMSGRLKWIKDGIFCQDLIDAHRKNLIADKDGAYTAISKRANQNALSTIVSGGEASIATASNIVVMTEATAQELELSMAGRLKDFQAREKLLRPTTVMLMAVIDPMFDRVTIYHRGIAQPTDVGLRDLKASNKGTGPDVGDILKAYQVGSAASL